MGIDLELWRARIGLYNCGRVRQGSSTSQIRALVRTMLEAYLVWKSRQQKMNQTENPPLSSRHLSPKPKPMPHSNLTKSSELSVRTALEDGIHTTYLVMVVCSRYYSICIVKSEDCSIKSMFNYKRLIRYGVSILLSVVVVTVFLSLLLIMAGDVEVNPGPQHDLTVHDLKVVVNKLAPVQHMWFKIGIQLGMRNEELRSLKAGHEFHEMLEIWLRGGTGVPTTWSSLVEALKSPDVSKPKLGDELQAEYIEQATQCTLEVEAQLNELVTAFQLKEEFLCQELSQKYIVKVYQFLDCWEKFARAANFEEHEVVAIERDGKDEDDKKYRTLYRWYEMKLLDATSTFRVLIETLLAIKRVDIAQKVCKLQDSIIQGIEKGNTAVMHPTAVCDTSEPTTDVEQPPRKRRKIAPPAAVLRRTFPNLSTSGLSEAELKAKVPRLFLDSSELCCKFHQLYSNLYLSLDNRNVPKKRLVTCLLGLDAFSPVYKSSDQPLFKDQLTNLRAAEDIEEIWLILKHYCSYFNYYLVEHITDQLGTDNDKQRMKSYKEAFVGYVKRRVFESPAEFGSTNKEDCTIVVKLDKSYDDCTADQLVILQGKLCDILNLSHNGVLRLCTVEQGCYELTFQAPAFVQDIIFPLSPEQEGALKELGVVWLLCGDYEFSSQQSQEDGDSPDDDDDDEDKHPDDASQGTTLYERVDAILQQAKKSLGSTSDSGVGKSVLDAETKSLISEFSEDMFGYELPVNETELDQQAPLLATVPSPLNVAAYNGDLVRVKYCIEVLQCDPLQFNHHGNTTLHIAADGGQLEVLKYLIEEKQCIPATLSLSDRSPLHIAALNGCLPLVRYFIKEHEVDPLLQDNQQKTPLHNACRNGNTEVVGYIIAQAEQHDAINVIVRDKTKLGSSLLHFAAASGSLKLVQHLITNYNLHPNTPGQIGATPLLVAAQEGQLNVVQYLASLTSCDIFCTLQKVKQNALHIAAGRGHLAVVKFLTAEKKLDPNMPDSAGSTALHLAARSGHIDTTVYLVEECKCDILCMTNKKRTPLHLAAAEGHINVVHYITKQRGVYPLFKHISSITPLHLAVKAGQLEVVTFYLEEVKCKLDTPDRVGEKLLLVAVKYGNLPTVKTLATKQTWTNMKSGFRQNQLILEAVTRGHLDVLKYFILEKSWEFILLQFYKQSSLVHIAALEGHLDILKFFITDLNYNPNLVDHVKMTPLHRACQGGHLKIVKFLVDDCEVNKSPKAHDGLTPLHFAAIEGHYQIVEFLILICGVNSNCSDSLGNTALHYAAGKGKLNVVKFLVFKTSASPKAANKQGVIPLHFACGLGLITIRDFWSESKSGSSKKNKRTAFTYTSTEEYLSIVETFAKVLDIGQPYGDRNGVTPLHIASASGQQNIVNMLLQARKSDINSLTDRESGRTPIHYAALAGELESLKCLTFRNPHGIFCTDWSGKNALHIAAFYGHVSIVKYLVSELHMDPNIQVSIYPQPAPLHIACQQGHKDVVEYLLSDRRCKSNCRDNNGSMPLHFAVDWGNINLIRFLVEEKRWDPMCRDCEGNTPLHIAVQFGHLSIVKYFVDTLKIDPSLFTLTMTPLHDAARHGWLDIVKYLILEKKCDPMRRDKNNYIPAAYAVNFRRFDVLKFLLEINPLTVDDFKNTNLLHVAATVDDLRIWNLVVSQVRTGGIIYHMHSNMGDLKGVTPLHMACICGHIDIVKQILEDNPCSKLPQDDYMQTPLHHAVRKENNLDIIKFLTLEKGFDAMCTDINGDTPLHFAARRDDVDVVDFYTHVLKCNPYTPNKRGNTPYSLLHYICDPLTVGQSSLHIAAEQGKLHHIECFIKSQKISPNCVDRLGRTPLHYAAMKGKLKAVELLLQAKASPLAEDVFHNLPLHYAAALGHLDVVKTLIHNKSPYDTIGVLGLTPVRMASAGGHHNVSTYLIELLTLHKFEQGCIVQ